MSEKQAAAVGTQSSNYEQFCRRVGIWPMTTRAAANGKVERPATNKGTYESLVNSQRKTRAEYYTTASLINIALFSQIIIAAAVTAVSAAGGPRVAVTVLGALNTVLAGSLTWVKGQGLPDRLLSYANELRRVREHIEDLERQYEEKPDFVLDVDLEAKKIYTMYDNARKNAENAYVGTFQKLGADALKGDWRSTKNRPDGSGPGSGGNSSGATGANGAIAQQTVARV
jgi:SMODS and SLOG-associating 2TM effector domain